MPEGTVSGDGRTTVGATRVLAADAGDYALGPELGRGGMGVVYAARQAGLERTIAVKVARQVGDAEARLMAEAAVTGRLEHPGIIPVYETGRDERGRPFYAMRRIHGDSWRVRLGLSTRERNLDVLERVAEAVAYAHAQGVAHADLKPANVMLGAFGEVLVLDWGLALDLRRHPVRPLAPEGAIGGTPAYMAPEQARQDATALGAATDVYLLGGCLCEILTGAPPHAGADAVARIAAAAAGRVDAPLPDDALGRLARTCLEADPSRRPVDAGAFLVALRTERARAAGEERIARALAWAGQGDADACQRAARLLATVRDADPARLTAACRQVRHAHAAAACAAGDLALAQRLSGDAPALALRVQMQLAQRRRRERSERLLRWAMVATAVITAGILAAEAWLWLH